MQSRIILPSKLSVVPDDTYFGNQWSLQNLGTYAGGTYGADIRAVDAWSVSIGDHNVVVAILDTGVDYGHPDLVGNIWSNTGETSCTDGIDNDDNDYIDDCRGWDFVTCEELVCDEFDDKGNCVNNEYSCAKEVSRDNDPMDEDGHGTHVAGIAGATGFNTQGITGVMMRVRLMPVRVLNAEGEGTYGDIAAGIDYAVRNGTKMNTKLVINASLGGSEISSALYDAIAAANTAGVLLVAAAGNDGSNNDALPVYPASYNLPNVIAVAATDQNDRRASFSNFGPASVHVAAPGVYILSTVPTWWANSQGYGQLDYNIGTSMATAHVSGLAGLLWSYYTYFDYSQIRGTILRNVDTYLDNKPNLETLRDYVWSDGRINAYKAMWSLLPAKITTVVPSTTQIVLNWEDNAVGEDGFKIERKVGGGSYTTLPSLPANSVTFTDSGLTDGTEYTYRIKATALLPNPPSTSPVQAESFEETRAVATLLAPPTNLIASAESESDIALEWTDNSSTEQGFRIERRKSLDDSWVEIAQVSGSSYTDSGLDKFTTYMYRVRAYNAAVNSEYSDTASARTTSGGGGGGGGGCSIGARQNMPTAIADLAILLIPMIVIVLYRRKRI